MKMIFKLNPFIANDPQPIRFAITNPELKSSSLRLEMGVLK